MSLSVHRGEILHFLHDPGDGRDSSGWEHFPDGLLVIADGRVAACGPAAALLPTLPAAMPVTRHVDALLIPGFIDCHLHYPQTGLIGADAGTLLDWLQQRVLPAEAAYADADHAATMAEVCLDEMLRNGTTTAMVFASSHAVSVDAFFAAAQRRRLRMICGKVLMDRNCPEALRDTADSGDRDSRTLIDRWHRRDRLHYAITPRFAPTSSGPQLVAAGRLAAQQPDLYIHSHLAENSAEVAWVRDLFPGARSYLDVYERFGLLRERAVYAHCLHLDDTDRRRFAASGAAAAFCPTSNLFLGSGLFDLDAADAIGMRWALASDVGAGTTFSMLGTMREAQKVARLRGQHLPALRALYMATLGGARALRLDERIGSFRAGREADFVVLDLKATPLLAWRCAQATDLADRLMALITLGDDRAVRETFILGEPSRPRA